MHPDIGQNSLADPVEEVEAGEDGHQDEPEPEEDVDLLVDDVDRQDALGVMSLDGPGRTVPGG